MRFRHGLPLHKINATATFYNGLGGVDADTGMYVGALGDQLFAAIPAQVTILSTGETVQAGADTETLDLEMVCNTADIGDTVSHPAVVVVTSTDLGFTNKQFEILGRPVRAGGGSGLTTFRLYQSQADDLVALA